MFLLLKTKVNISLKMFGLIGYALLSIITTLVLSPVIKFGKGFSSYLCVLEWYIW